MGREPVGVQRRLYHFIPHNLFLSCAALLRYPIFFSHHYFMSSSHSLRGHWISFVLSFYGRSICTLTGPYDQPSSFIQAWDWLVGTLDSAPQGGVIIKIKINSLIDRYDDYTKRNQKLSFRDTIVGLQIR